MPDEKVTSRKAFNIPVDPNLHARVKACADWKGQSMRTWIRRTLTAEVERQEADQAEDERRRRSRRGGVG